MSDDMPEWASRALPKELRSGVTCGSIAACAALIAALLEAPAVAAAGKVDVGFGAELDSTSRYTWRGIALGEGPALQPSMWLWIEDFTLSLWGNLPLHPDDGAGIPDETDVILEWEREVAGLSIRAGALAYLYPKAGGSGHTAEIQVELRYPSGTLGAYTLQSVDVAANPGAYWGEAGISLIEDWGGTVGMEFELGLGWASEGFNESNYGTAEGGLDCFLASLAVSWQATDRFYLRLHAEASALLRAELRAAGNDPYLLSAGVAAGVELP